MKKIVSTLLLIAASFFGGVSSYAQLTIDLSDVEPMQPEYQTLADGIMQTQLTDPEAANKQFSKLLKKLGKNTKQLTAAGKYFVEQKVYPCAKQCANFAYQTDATYVPALKLGAAVSLMRRDYGGAGQKMDEILLLEPNNIEAMRLAARIYKYVNPYAAKEYLAKILEQDPNNIIAYKELGDIDYEADDFKEAVENYDKFFNNSELNVDYALSYSNYMNSLFAMGQKTKKDEYYTQLLDVVGKVETLGYEDINTYRMRFFADMELFRDNETPNSVKYITEKKFADSLYVYRDYAYCAAYTRDQGDIEGALAYYQKGLDRDSSQFVAYKEMSKLYRRLKQGDKAIESQELYIEKKEASGAKVELTDERDLVLCYLAAKNAADSLDAKMAYAEKGDLICQKMIELKPDSYQGYYYRADLWMMDRNTAEEKPYQYYCKVLEVLGDNEDYGQQIGVAATYAAFYFYNKQDLAQCKVYAEKALKFDPTNATSQALLKVCQ